MSTATAPRATSATTPRVTFYVTSFSDLDPLVTCARQGLATHALIGLIHFGYNDPAKTQPYIHLNDNDLDDPTYAPLWSTVPTLQAAGMKVLGSVGGGGVGDFGNLFASEQSYATFYALLRDALRAHNLDGLDLDIEEPSVTTAQVERLVTDLRRDFSTRPGGFLLTSAPVASALTGGGSVSPNVDYNKLLPAFDYYNLQFYNGFGDIVPGNNPPDYDDVIKACGIANANRLAACILTNPNSGYGYEPLHATQPILATLATRYPNYGGVTGWNYQNALDPNGNLNPTGWAAAVRNPTTTPPSP